MEHLVRPRYDRRVAGVCGAFAHGYGWDLTVVRLVTVAIAFFTGVGFLAYLFCWIAIPEEPVALPPYHGSYAGGYPPPSPPNYPSNTPPAV